MIRITTDLDRDDDAVNHDIRFLIDYFWIADIHALELTLIAQADQLHATIVELTNTRNPTWDQRCRLSWSKRQLRIIRAILNTPTQVMADEVVDSQIEPFASLIVAWRAEQ